MLDVGLTEALILIASMLVTGGLAGVVAGLLGVGGGIVIVPVLFFVLLGLGVPEEVRMHLAVGTSLATIIFTGFSSARAHWKKGSVDLDLLKRWGPSVAVGVILGTVIGGRVDALVLTLVFAIVAALVAVNMAFRPESFTLSEKLPRRPFNEAIAGIVGVISVMMGIGGGTLSVPILTLFNFPIRRAVGTASAIGLIIAIPGTLGYGYFGLGAEGLPPFSLGYVNLAGLVTIIPASMACAPFGAKIAHTIPPRVLRYCFAAFLAVTSARMLYGILT